MGLWGARGGPLGVWVGLWGRRWPFGSLGAFEDRGLPSGLGIGGLEPFGVGVGGLEPFGVGLEDLTTLFKWNLCIITTTEVYP
jgi:hypothetical protein